MYLCILFQLEGKNTAKKSVLLTFFYNTYWLNGQGHQLHHYNPLGLPIMHLRIVNLHFLNITWITYKDNERVLIYIYTIDIEDLKNDVRLDIVHVKNAGRV